MVVHTVETCDINFDEVCRTCLVKCDNLISLFRNANTLDVCDYANMLSQCTKIQITQTDGFPNKVCSTCVLNIKSAFAFKQRAEKTNALLHNCLLQKQHHIETESETDIKVEVINVIKAESNIIHEELVNVPETKCEDASDVKFTENDDFSDEDLSPLISLKKTIVNTSLQQLDNVKDLSFKCNVCKQLFSKLSQVQSHTCDAIYSAKETSLDTYDCVSCNKKLRGNKQFEEHLRLHIASNASELNGHKAINHNQNKSMMQLKIQSFLLQQNINGDDNSNDIYEDATAHSTDGSELTDLILDRKYFCDICDKLFVTHSYFQTHMKKHVETKPSTCRICGMSYKRNTLLMKHVMSHTVLDKLLNINFKSKLKLFDDHEKYTDLDPIIESNQRLCEIVVEDIRGGRWQRYITPSVPNVDTSTTCHICGVDFIFQWALNKHLRRAHRPQKSIVRKIPKTYQCQTCDKYFTTSDKLARHSTVHASAEDKKFECAICRKKFHRKENIRLHLNVHFPKKKVFNFLCAYCGKSLTNASNLAVHVRKHTGEKPHKCEMCGKGFPRSSDLNYHRRTHTGEKPCLCTICGRGFSRASKLGRHMRIHTGQRPYKCTHCTRSFTQSNDLTLHIRRHTGDKPYECTVCYDRFITGTMLRNHKRLLKHNDLTTS